MKAIYEGKLYVVVDTVGDEIILERNRETLTVPLGTKEPNLIIDPTDFELTAWCEEEDLV